MSVTPTMDINEVFRAGGRAVEFLDQINKASIVMLDETGLVAHALAVKIAQGIAQIIEEERKTSPTRSADYQRRIHGARPPRPWWPATRRSEAHVE